MLYGYFWFPGNPRGGSSHDQVPGPGFTCQDPVAKPCLLSTGPPDAQSHYSNPWTGEQLRQKFYSIITKSNFRILWPFSSARLDDHRFILVPSVHIHLQARIFWTLTLCNLLCCQIARLRSELDVVRANTKVMSEMLTEMVPGKEDPSDLELLQVRKKNYYVICSLRLLSHNTLFFSEWDSKCTKFMFECSH